MPEEYRKASQNKKKEFNSAIRRLYGVISRWYDRDFSKLVVTIDPEVVTAEQLKNLLIHLDQQVFAGGSIPTKAEVSAHIEQFIGHHPGFHAERLKEEVAKVNERLQALEQREQRLQVR